MQITPLGDSALVIRVLESGEIATGGQIERVLETKQRVESARIPGVIEVTSAYTTVGVFYEPVDAIDAGAPVEDVLGWIEEKIRAAVLEKSRADRVESRLIEIPVCYHDEFALDRDAVTRHTGLDWNEVVDLHSGADYRVHCVGFTPGFPFLGGLPQKLATPRKGVPRKEIPAGSVAIGGSQTGIYPIKSPGGWNVIGRTPLRLFDPQQNPPALLRAGDRVRLRPIARGEFERSTT